MLSAAVGLVLLGVGASPALAAHTRLLVNHFGTLSNPTGLAIDQSTGDLYVADTGAHQVQEFDSAGNHLRSFGTQGTAPGQFEAPSFIAVDNDASSPSFNDVYVADTGDDTVTKFDSEGNLIASWGDGGQLAVIPAIATGSGDTASGPATGTGDLAAAFGSGDLTAGSKIVSNVTTGVGTFEVGMTTPDRGEITQTIPAGTTITAVGSGTLTLSNAATATRNGFALQAGSRTVGNLTTSTGSFNVGQGIEGQGIPASTHITAVSPGTLTLSKGANNIATGSALATNTRIVSDLATSVGSFAAGQILSGPGIPSGDAIEEVGPDYLALTEGATAAATGVSLSAARRLRGPFGEHIGGIAVGVDGTLYILDTPRLISQIEPGGGSASEVRLQTERGTAPIGLTVDATGNIFRANGDGSIEKFSPTGEDIGQVSGGGAIAFAIEPAGGDLYTATEAKSIDHYAFDGSGDVIEPEGPSCVVAPGVGCAPTATTALPFAPSGLDIGPAGLDAFLANPTAGEVDVYEESAIPTVTTGAPTEVAAHTATLNGTVNPTGLQVTECFFEYLSEAERERDETEGKGAFAGAHVVQCESGLPVDEADHPVEAKITGLKAGTAYHYRLIAANAKDAGNVPNPGAEESLHTAPPPAIGESTATEVGEHSARLNAAINPEGSPTTCTFQYGTDTSYGLDTNPCSPQPGLAAGTFSTVIEGLEPDVTYHWRILATNQNETTVGVDHTFIFLTPPPHESCPNEAFRVGPSAALPDCRAYEQVSPTHKNGALLGDLLFAPPPGIATDGSRLVQRAIQCFAAASCNALYGNNIGSPYSFARTSAGWSTTALSPPASLSSAVVNMTASADTGASLFAMSTPPHGESDFYLRRPDGSLVDIGPATDPQAGAHGTEPRELAVNMSISRVVWEPEVTKVGQLWPFDHSVEGSAIYEYSGTANDHPLLIGVSGGYENGENHSLIGRCGTALGSPANRNPEPVDALSSDGRTVYFTVYQCASGTGANEGIEVPANAIYARIDGESPDAHTVAISARSSSGCTGACQTSVPVAAAFEGASEDGSIAVFSSTQQLLDDATQDHLPSDSAANGGCRKTSGTGCNLYLYDFSRPEGERLIDLSAGDTSRLGPRVRQRIAISPDGSHVYFIAKGVLTGQNAEGARPISGVDNLYVYQRDAVHPAGQLAFVASLPGSDTSGESSILNGDSNVTSDGRFFVFLSHGDLTPDDTSRSGAAQVFRYDAQAETLTRISIGEHGFDDDGNRSASTPCTNLACSEDAGIVGSTPNERTDPTMSTDGSRIFFTSPVALTPGALDDKTIGLSPAVDPAYANNIYEWQEPGTETDGRVSCHEASGCVSLVSDGQDATFNNGSSAYCSNEASSVCLLGTDATGENVFFSTADQLTPSDTDTELDYYDARIGGGFAPPPTPVPCPTSEACHQGGTGEGSNLSLVTPTFGGPEEDADHPQKPTCKKGQVKKHGKCVKKANKKKGKKHHGKKSHKRANGNRGGGK